MRFHEPEVIGYQFVYLNMWEEFAYYKYVSTVLKTMQEYQLIAQQQSSIFFATFATTKHEQLCN